MSTPEIGAVILIAVMGPLEIGQSSSLPRRLEFSFGQVALTKNGDLVTITRGEGPGDPRRFTAESTAPQRRTVLISRRDCAGLWGRIDSDTIRAYATVPSEALEHTPPDVQQGDHLLLVIDERTTVEWSYSDLLLVKARRAPLEEIERSILDVWDRRVRHPVTPRRLRISISERCRQAGSELEIVKKGDTATIAVKLPGGESGGECRRLSMKEVQSVWGTVLHERILDREFGATEPSDPSATPDTVRSLSVVAEGVTLVDFSHGTDFYGRQSFEALLGVCRTMSGWRR